MSTPPYRQIRALYDEATITVYQAYPSTIALPALASQSFSASPDFSPTRMTWIKPSWCWMMSSSSSTPPLHPTQLTQHRYRSGYSYKDPRQSHILALRLRCSAFEELLSAATVSGVSGAKGEVRVQWDPERGVEVERLAWRSLQVGVGKGVVGGRWAEGVVGIEDVTERAREMKRLVDEGRVEEAGALVPEEREYPVSEELRELLGMNRTE